MMWLSEGDTLSVDHALRTESIESDLDDLVARLDWPRDLLKTKLAHANRSRWMRGQRPSPESREILRERYQADFEALDFTP
jgi:hypothetical protein